MSGLRVAVLGGAGQAREIAWYVRANGHECVAFIIRDSAAPEPYDGPLAMLRDETWLADNLADVDALVVGIADPILRRRVAAIGERIHPTAQWPAFIHPSATIDRTSLTLGRGVIVGAGAVVTTDVILGDHALVNFGATVGHDAVIGIASVINPGASVSGGVRMGEGVLVGAGAVIRQYLTVGDGATIGAGAVVTKDVGVGVTVVGVPARRREEPA